MSINLETISYQEFKNWCNDRACDGKWNKIEALACLQVIGEIDNIKVKGFFKKRKTLEARELEWKKRDYKTLVCLIYSNII